MQRIAKTEIELASIAKEIISNFPEKRIFAFQGEMGAGKTTFIHYLCQALQVTDATSSPTFSLVNEYISSTFGSIYHFDFYRINKLEEAYDMGYEEYFFSGNYCFIEWSEKVAALLPAETVLVDIHVLSGETRQITVN